MSRRADPERIHAARREANLRRLIGEGEVPDRAEAWIAHWEAEAARQGLADEAGYRDSGWDWIAIQRCGAIREWNLVGAAGFEPTTTSPPDWCATRLRHAPTGPESTRGLLSPE